MRMRYVIGLIPACLAVVVLLFFLSGTNGCSCVQTRPYFLQELFCSSHFVVEVFIRRSKIVKNGALRRYHIRTTKVYKTSPEYDSVMFRNVIYTPPNSAACGVTLQKGVKYVIPGNVTRGKIFIYLCTFRGIRSDQLTPYQSCHLQHGYSQNCNKCQIKYCSYPEKCGRKIYRNACVFNQGPSAFRCFNKYALCQRVIVGLFSRCRWGDDDGRLDTCLEQVS